MLFFKKIDIFYGKPIDLIWFCINFNIDMKQQLLKSVFYGNITPIYRHYIVYTYLYINSKLIKIITAKWG